MPLIEARIGGRNDAEGAFKFLFSKIGRAISPWPDTSVPRDEKGCYGPVPPDFLLRPGFVLFEDAINYSIELASANFLNKISGLREGLRFCSHLLSLNTVSA